FFGITIGRNDDPIGLTDGLGGTISVQAFGRPIPGGDDSVQIKTGNGVVGRLDNGPEEGRTDRHQFLGNPPSCNSSVCILIARETALRISRVRHSSGGLIQATARSGNFSRPGWDCGTATNGLVVGATGFVPGAA